jgi:hypothetical protein
MQSRVHLFSVCEPALKNRIRYGNPLTKTPNDLVGTQISKFKTAFEGHFNESNSEELRENLVIGTAIPYK